MTTAIRVLQVGPDQTSRALASHVRTLSEAGHGVIYVTADRPYVTLRETLRDAGVSVEAIFIIDAVTYMDGRPVAENYPNALFLRSPTMLEMLAMRVEQALSQVQGVPIVVVDSLSALMLYNGLAPVQEFTHYLANRLRTNGVRADLVVRANTSGNELYERIRMLSDDSLSLGEIQ